MARSFQEELEQLEYIQILIDNGYGEFVDAFLSNEAEVYTKKSRLNKSGACRVLDCKTKQLEDIMEECRKILGEDSYF